jgi:hypothetical protein
VKIALEELTQRCPPLRLEPDEMRSADISFRGPQRLWVMPSRARDAALNLPQRL